MESHGICVLGTGLAHLYNVFKAHPCRSLCQNFLPFSLRLNNTPSYIRGTCSLPVRRLVDTWVVSTFWLLWAMLLGTSVYKPWLAFNKENSSRRDGMSVPRWDHKELCICLLILSCPLGWQPAAVSWAALCTGPRGEELAAGSHTSELGSDLPLSPALSYLRPP